MPHGENHEVRGILIFGLGIPVGMVFGLALMAASRGGDHPVQPRQLPTAPDHRFTSYASPVEHMPSASDLVDVERAVTKAFERVKAFAVTVEADHFDDPLDPRGERAIGGGVIVSPDGLILTAGHVVDRPDKRVTVTLPDGSQVPGRSLGVSLYSDAGMVRLQKRDHYPHATIAGNDTAPSVGDWCFALGHPGGPDSDRGIVLRLGRILEIDPLTLRTSCKLLGGDSGGPLFDLEGRLVGIHSRISEDVNENYHINAAAYVRRWAALLTGRTLGEEEGIIGVHFNVLDPDLTILGVQRDSGAMGVFETGDRVTHLNGEHIQNWDLFKALVAEHAPGESVTVDFVRNGKENSVEVVLSKNLWTEVREPVEDGDSPPPK